MTERVDRHTADVVSDMLLIMLNDLELVENITPRVEWIGRELAVSLRVRFAGTHPITVRVSVKVPADWWQAVRERWLPSWWLKRRPVITRAVSEAQTVHQMCCPHMRLSPQRDHLEWLSSPLPREQPYIKVARCNRCGHTAPVTDKCWSGAPWKMHDLSCPKCGTTDIEGNTNPFTSKGGA